MHIAAAIFKPPNVSDLGAQLRSLLDAKTHAPQAFEKNIGGGGKNGNLRSPSVIGREEAGHGGDCAWATRRTELGCSVPLGRVTPMPLCGPPRALVADDPPRAWPSDLPKSRDVTGVLGGCGIHSTIFPGGPATFSAHFPLRSMVARPHSCFENWEMARADRGSYAKRLRMLGQVDVLSSMTGRWRPWRDGTARLPGDLR